MSYLINFFNNKIESNLFVLFGDFIDVYFDNLRRDLIMPELRTPQSTTAAVPVA